MNVNSASTSEHLIYANPLGARSEAQGQTLEKTASAGPQTTAEEQAAVEDQAAAEGQTAVENQAASEGQEYYESAALSVLDAVGVVPTPAALMDPVPDLALNRPNAPWSVPHNDAATATVQQETVGTPASGDVAPAAAPNGDTTSALAEGATAPDDESAVGGRDLSEEEQREVDELKKRDREVRDHEQAHVAAAGQYATSGPTYDYQSGPDGRRYAVGGEVDIDTSKVPDDPEATLQKAQVIYRAALAPADPSSQDRRVAAEARQMQGEAQWEIAENRREGNDSAGADGVDGGRGEGTNAAAADGAERVVTAPGSAASADTAVSTVPDIDHPDVPGGASFDGVEAGQILDLLA